MHAGLHTPACILNQTFSPLGIPPRFMPVEIRSKWQNESYRCRRAIRPRRSVCNLYWLVDKPLSATTTKIGLC